MSTDNRLRLGPAALKLIEGRGENKQSALDDAIVELEQQLNDSKRLASNGGGACSLDGAVLDRLMSAVQHQSSQIVDLRHVVEMEMRMVRALIASLMSTSDEAQRKVMEIAVRASEEMRKPTAPKGLNASLEQDEQEREARQIVMREMERGADHGPRQKEDGLER